MSSLRNKVVLITGASSGIGAAIAKECADQGAKVVLVARRKDKLETLARILGSERTIALEADVCDRARLDKVVQETLNKFGSLDVVFANAGFGVIGIFHKLTMDDYRRQFETNVFGVMNTLQASFEALRKSQGRVAIIGSVAGYNTLPAMTPYSMSKYAVRALAEGLHFEWMRFGISVTHIAPGFVESEFRHIDNVGKYVPESKDGIPKRFVMPAETAAKQIVRAVVKRKQEAVITRHGKFLVFMRNHFWPLWRRLIVAGKVTARDEARAAKQLPQ